MAKDPVDPSKNAEATVKMKEALQNAEISANNLRASFDQQLKVVIQLRNTMQEVANIMGSFSNQTAQQGSLLSEETWGKVEKKVKDASSAHKKYNEAAAKTSKVMGMVSASAKVAVAFIEGLEQGISNLYSITKSLTSVLTGVTKGVFNFAKSLIMMPFELIDWLFDKSRSASDTSLATAIENVREQFGSLRSESSRTVIDVAKGMGKLDNTGVSAYKIFGTVAQRVEAVNKMATSMGATFQVFQKEIMANGEAIMRYNRGLGITDEQMASIASTATRMGKDIAQVQNEMTKQALGMSKAFGVNAKVISRDMAKAMQDLAHFGHLSTKEIAVAATFANKLGVSVDKLTGILDATKTYDNTAEQVSRLNEQFNLNIDAQELMMAENPAAQVAMLQKAFSAAGHDVSKMNRFQREVIKSTGFMSDELLNASLSAKGMSVSYDNMNKQGDKNEQKVMSQTEAMKELADSMKRIVQTAQTVKGGILSQIIAGFKQGIESSPEFIKLMENMNVILSEAYQLGIRLGKAFVRLFPGMKDIIGGLADMFNPQRYRNMFSAVEEAFKEFEKGGPDSMNRFMKKVEAAFGEFFKAGSPGSERIVKGIQSFGSAIIVAISKLVVWVTDELAKALPKMFEFLLNPKMSLKKAPTGPWEKMFAPLGDAIMHAIDTLGPILEKGFKSLWDKYWPKLHAWLKETWPKVAPVIAGILFGPAVINALIGAAVPMLLKGLLNVFSWAGKGLGKAASSLFSTIGPPIAEFFSSVGSKFLSGASKLAAKIGPSLMKAIPFVGVAVVIADAGINVSKAIKEFSGTLEKQGFDPATSKIAAGTTGLINTLTLGLLPKDLQQQIATSTAEIADKLFKSLGNIFGDSFVKDVKRYLSGLFDVFGGIGDLLMSIFKGDTDGIEAAFKKIGSGLWDMMVTNFSMSLKILLRLPPMILEYFYKALGWVSNKVGDWFLSLKDLPVLGPIFELFGEIFKDIGKLFNDIGGLWKSLGDQIKKIDITKIFADMWNYITSKIIPILKTVGEFFSAVGKIIADFSKTIWNFITAVGSVIANVFMTVAKFFADIGKWIWEKLSPIATEIIKYFSDLAYSMWEVFIAPFKGIVQFFRDLFDKGVGGAFEGLIENLKSYGVKVFKVMYYPFIKAFEWIKENINWDAVGKTFEDIWQGIKNFGQKLFDVLTWPYRKAWEAIKAVFNWDTMKEIFFNVVAGIKEALGKIADIGPFKALIAIAKKVFKIESPSKVFSEIGENVADGFNASLKSIPKETEKTFKEAGKVAKDTISTQAPNISVPQAATTTPGSAQNATSVMSTLDDVGEIMKKVDIAKTISGIVSSFPEDKQKSATKTVKSLYSIFNELSELTNKLSSIRSVSDGDVFMKAVWAIRGNLMRLTADWGRNPLQDIIESSSEIGKYATVAAKNQVSKSIKAVTDMVKTIQELDDAIAKLPTVDIGARLDKLATASGLGAGGVYTVKSREVVMNFDIKITMDAGKLEEVMVFRKESVIRDRLNYALASNTGKNEVAAGDVSLRLNNTRPTPISPAVT